MTDPSSYYSTWTEEPAQRHPGQSITVVDCGVHDTIGKVGERYTDQGWVREDLRTGWREA